MRLLSVGSTCLGILLLLMLGACGLAGPEDTDPPSTPSGLTVTSGDGRVNLNWSRSSASNVAGYNLYRSQSSFSDARGLTPVNGSSVLDETSFTDQEVENGTTYYYRLTVVDEKGNESRLSDEVKGTPFPNPPDRP